MTRRYELYIRNQETFRNLSQGITHIITVTAASVLISGEYPIHEGDILDLHNSSSKEDSNHLERQVEGMEAYSTVKEMVRKIHPSLLMPGKTRQQIIAHYEELSHGLVGTDPRCTDFESGLVALFLREVEVKGLDTYGVTPITLTVSEEEIEESTSRSRIAERRAEAKRRTREEHRDERRLRENSR